MTEKWTVHDKLAMYRGLIKIFNREEENQKRDTKRQKVKNINAMQKLKGEIKSLREDLADIDMQVALATSNILRDHQDLRTVVLNMDGKAIKTFLKRKLEHVKTARGSLMTELHVQEEAYLNSVLLLNKTEVLTPEKLSKIDAVREKHSRIQELKAKINASKNVEHIYRKIIYLLRTDQKSFELILEKLRSDQTFQEHCFIRATSMGQLAIEDVANMEKDYKLKDTDVKKNVKQQMYVLRELRFLLAETEKDAQGLIRSESFHLLNVLENEEPHKDELAESIDQARAQLRKIQDVLLVPGFNDIYPRLAELLRQNDRLIEELNKNHERFEMVMNLRLLLHSKLIAVRSLEYDDNSFLVRRGLRFNNVMRLRSVIGAMEKEITETVNYLYYLRSVFRRLTHVMSSAPGFADPHLPKDLPVSKQVLELLEFLKLSTPDVRKSVGGVRHDETEKIGATFLKKMMRNLDFSVKKEEHKVVLEMVEPADAKVPSRSEIKARSKKVVEMAMTKLYE